MLVKNKKQKTKSLVRSFARAHGVFTLLIFMFYVAFAIFGDFSLLARDIKDKYAWAAATNLSVYVMSIPNQPEVSVVSACVNDQAVASLSWEETAATDYYDVMRDEQMRISGITQTSFVDDVVSVGTDYAYVVVAHGPLGSISSVSKTVRVQECVPEPPLPSPTCQIIALDGEPIDFSMPVRTENRTPRISGTTNMPNANMSVNILRGEQLFSTSSMNAASNGFWEYGVDVPLDLGVYTFQVTSTDPLDSARNITKNLQLEIVEKDNDDRDNDEDTDDDKCGDGDWITICHQSETPGQKTKSIPHRTVGGHIRHGDSCGACKKNIVDKGDIILPQDPGPNNGGIPVDSSNYPEERLPLTMQVEIINKNKLIFPGQDIFIEVFLDWKERAPQKIDLVYEIINERGIIMSSMVRNNKASAETLEQIVPIPKDIEYGRYILRLRTKVDGIYVTAQDSFEYREAPLVNFGGTISFTYAELVSGIGWFALVCLLLLLLLFIILIHEYFLYSRSVRTITEKGLEKEGLISKRKEVSL